MVSSTGCEGESSLFPGMERGEKLEIFKKEKLKLKEACALSLNNFFVFFMPELTAKTFFFHSLPYATKLLRS